MAAKVLIVDDSKTVRVSLRNALTAIGLDVVEAEHGEEALTRLSDTLTCADHFGHHYAVERRLWSFCPI